MDIKKPVVMPVEPAYLNSPASGVRREIVKRHKNVYLCKEKEAGYYCVIVWDGEEKRFFWYMGDLLYSHALHEYEKRIK